MPNSWLLVQTGSAENRNQARRGREGERMEERKRGRDRGRERGGERRQLKKRGEADRAGCLHSS